MTTKPLGSVIHVTKSNYVIVKLSESHELPHVGVEVVNANNEVIGKVIDIIGPTAQPFAVIKPLKHTVTSLLKPTSFLFYRIPRKSGKKGRRHEL